MVRDSVLSLPRAWLQPPVWELKSHKPHGEAIKQKSDKQSPRVSTVLGVRAKQPSSLSSLSLIHENKAKQQKSLYRSLSEGESNYIHRTFTICQALCRALGTKQLTRQT